MVEPGYEEPSDAGHTSKIQDAADNVKSAVFNTAGNAVGAGVAASKAVGDAVTGAAQKSADAARPYVVNQYTEAAAKPFVSAAKPVIEQYNNLLSPVVSGEGEGFGEDVSTLEVEQVILRIEISASSDVKAMRRCSFIIVAFSIFATIALIVMKLETDANQQLESSNQYFLSSVVIAAFFLVILLIVAVVFIRRIINAWRMGLVWSKRRMNIAASAFIILILQICNLSAMLASAAYSLSKLCRWQTQVVYTLGFVQWSLWNGTFLFLVIFAHNGSFWRGKTKAQEQERKAAEAAAKKKAKTLGNDASAAAAAAAVAAVEVPIPPPPPQQKGQQSSTALVMDAPARVHLPKFILWGALQGTLILMLVKFTVFGYGDSCASAQPLNCAPPSDVAVVGLVIHVLVMWFYFLFYSFFAWRTDKDLKTRPYTEMRLARMVFGIQHEQVFPVFFTFTVATTLFLVIAPHSCWTFVEVWVGVVPLQAMGTAMAGSLCYYFMPKKPGSAEEILQTWLQEYAWSEEQIPKAIQRRNAKLAASKTLASKPMFCIETAIKMLYYSRLAYSASEDELTNGRLDGDTIPEDSKQQPASSASAPSPPSADAAGPAAELTSTTAENQQNSESNVLQDVETGEMSKNYSTIPTIAFSKTHYKNLNNAEVFVEPSSDTKGIMLWGDNTIVVAFKGTSSFENALTDINILKTIHPPSRTAPMYSSWGLKLIPVPVRVHKGFEEAWTSHGFDKKILAKIDQIINEEFSYQDPESNTNSTAANPPRIFITGHSLGGIKLY
jgi:hypothetical protein